MSTYAMLLENKINEYFEISSREKIAPTMAGLALWLNFSSTASLRRYLKSKPEGLYLLETIEDRIYGTATATATAFDLGIRKNQFTENRKVNR